VQIELGFPIREAYITNLLEENTEKLETSGRSIEIYMTPFQIVTLRLVPA
jgi:hypothetical protein